MSLQRLEINLHLILISSDGIAEAKVPRRLAASSIRFVPVSMECELNQEGKGEGGGVSTCKAPTKIQSSTTID